MHDPGSALLIVSMVRRAGRSHAVRIPVGGIPGLVGTPGFWIDTLDLPGHTAA
jgi:hypothetical protein